MKILYFEDTPKFYAIYKTALEKAGFNVVHFINPPDNVVEIIKQEKPDLILTDIMMPDMDGFEMAAKVLQEEDLKNIPIFALSSMALDDYKQRGLQIGMRDYWFKNQTPPEVLVDKIKKILN